MIRCEIEDADGRSPTPPATSNDAIAAVSRVTGRKVKGFIPKHDKKTDVTTDTFILEPMRTKR